MMDEEKRNERGDDRGEFADTSGDRQEGPAKDKGKTADTGSGAGLPATGRRIGADGILYRLRSIWGKGDDE